MIVGELHVNTSVTLCVIVGELHVNMSVTLCVIVGELHVNMSVTLCVIVGELHVNMSVTLCVIVICLIQVHGDGSDAKNPSWSVELHPPDGFPFSCFPFCNKQKYVAPLIMAQFKNLPPDEEVNVWCRAFAKNIQLDKRDRAGAVRFTLRLNS